jgi:peptidoglycan/LPS O-acetylase OafA/YrhL
MKIEQLTFFRFIAASVVVIFHYGVEATGFRGILTAGPEMVTFFFVLSGFVMSINYSKKEVAFGSYWRARAARIMPVYLAALMLIVIAFMLSDMKVDPVSFLLNMFLLQSWFPSHATSLNTPGWSLSIEAFFYFSFPVLLILIKRYSVSAARALFFSFVLWCATQAVLTAVFSFGIYKGIYSRSHALIYYFPLSHFCSFALGIAGGMFILEHKTRISDSAASVIFFTAVLSVLILFINNQWEISEYIGLRFAYCSSFHAPLFLVFIISLAMCEHKIINIFKYKYFILLGNASYSMYMLQKPVHAAFLKFLSGKITLPPGYEFAVFFCLLAAISIMSFLFFEKPLNDFLRYSAPRILRRKRVPATLTDY